MSDDNIIALAHEDYNQGKELFALNATGCSLSDILLTLLITPMLCSIYQELCILLFKIPVGLVLVKIKNRHILDVPSDYYVLFILYLNLLYS